MRRLLIDGDIVAFTAASAAQHICMDHDLVYPIASKSVACALAKNLIIGFMLGLKGEACAVYLSDPKDNWRFRVDPTYKTNRTGEKPLLLTYLKDYLRAEHGAVHWEGLEADDVLSILGTSPFEKPVEQVYGGHGTVLEVPGELVIVGRDKDFKTIPGLHHAYRQDLDARGNMITREVTQWEADRFHMIQTLAGDRVDGFAGCPGMGMQRAAEAIDTPMRLVPKEGIKTRGVNKGEPVTKWVAEPTSDYWACIVSHYRKAGLGEREALTTARLARLLRHGEYDRETGAVTLWTPDKLPQR